MDIGFSDKPHMYIMEDDSRGTVVIENSEMMTYTLYEVIDTVIHPRPRAANRYMKQPYTFDALTGVMRIYRCVGECPATDEALEKLLGEAAKV